MRKMILFAIFAAVLVAGCTGQTFPGGQQGGDTIEEADIMVATNEPVVPSQPAADTEFTARFTVKNQHKTNKAEQVGVEIYDTGKCELETIGTTDAVKDENGVWQGLTADIGGPRMTFMPGQQELVKLKLKAPSSIAIGGLSYSCPIRYSVSYAFTAKSSMSFDVMSAARLEQLEAQTGERPVYTRTLNVGAGPLRVMMELASALPVEAGRKIFRFEMNVKNEGAGDYATITEGKLVLRIPEEFAVDDESNVCGGFFRRAGSKDTLDMKAYENKRPIDLMEKQSNTITCEISTPAAAAVPVEKMYTVSTELPYTYSYFGEEISVPITP